MEWKEELFFWLGKKGVVKESGFCWGKKVEGLFLEYLLIV